MQILYSIYTVRNSCGFITSVKNHAHFGQLPRTHGHEYPPAPVPCCSKTVTCEGNNRTWGTSLAMLMPSLNSPPRPEHKYYYKIFNPTLPGQGQETTLSALTPNYSDFAQDWRHIALCSSSCAPSPLSPSPLRTIQLLISRQPMNSIYAYSRAPGGWVGGPCRYCAGFLLATAQSFSSLYSTVPPLGFFSADLD